MYEKLQKNTAQYIVFPLVDADGDFVTGATITGVFNYWEKGVAPQASWSALTNAEVEIDSSGVYRVQLTAAETNHGYVAVMFTSATSKPQLLEYICMTGDPLSLSVHLPADIWSVGTKVITGGVLTTPADYKADVTNLDAAITSRAPANEYDTELDVVLSTRSSHNAAAIWAEAVKVITGGVLTTPNDYKADVSAIVITGGVLTTPADYMANVASLALEATVNSLNNLSSANVQTILETNDLDHLLKVAHPSGDPIADTIMDLIMNKDAGQTFDRASESLEAIRDRGDISWLTGGGGGLTQIIKPIFSVPNVIDLANTKSYRLGVYLINQLDDLPTTGEITPGTIDVHRSADGGTTWTVIVNGAAMNELAGMAYYDEIFDTGTGYTEGDMIRITFKGISVTADTNTFEICSSDGIMFYTYISGAAGGGATPQQIWEYATGGGRELSTPANYKATGFSTHDAAAIWSEAVKVITGGVLTTPADYKADVTDMATETNVNANETKIDTVITNIGNLNNITAASVWAVGTKVITGGVLTTPGDYKADVSAIVITGGVLTTPADYKANVSGLAPANEYDADFVTVKADLDNPAQYKADVSALALETSVQDIKVLTDNLPADTELELIKLKGLGGIWLVAEYHHDENNDNDYIQFWQYGSQADFDNETKVNAVNKWRQDITYTSNLPVKSKWDKVT